MGEASLLRPKALKAVFWLSFPSVHGGTLFLPLLGMFAGDPVTWPQTPKVRAAHDLSSRTLSVFCKVISSVCIFLKPLPFSIKKKKLTSNISTLESVIEQNFYFHREIWLIFFSS